VDPTILGGLVIRVGDNVLDDSVSGKLQGLRQSLH
jgi:F-type H+-transporting ATPase subunit b